MELLKEIIILLKKDMLVEWRQKYAIGGVLLYVISTVFVIYMALSIADMLQKLDAPFWNILFWMTLLFASVNAIAKSFFQEPLERTNYYYTIASPQAIIIAKMVYNAIIMIIISLLTFFIFWLLLGNPILHTGLFAIAILLGAMAFSFLFSMMSAIASKAGNNVTLLAILSFPLIIPIIMILLRLAGEALRNSPNMGNATNDIIILIALNAMLLAMSFVLFPYLWRD